MKVELIFVTVLLAALVLGCRLFGGSDDPAFSVPPIRLTGELATFDLCAAIPKQNFEAALGRKLVARPLNFELPDAKGSSGCSYNAGKDAQGNAYFGYAALAPAAAFAAQPNVERRSVSGIGRDAYFNNGPDARQLWIRVDDSLSVVVAFGDSPNETSALAIGRAIVAALQ